MGPVSYRRNAARFIALLMRGNLSLAELADKTPMDYDRARTFVRDLKAEGVVHIAAWRRDSMNRASIAVYQLGLGVDAPKPRARTGVERTRKYKTKEAPLRKAPIKIDAVRSVFDLGRDLCSAPSAAPTPAFSKPEPSRTA